MKRVGCTILFSTLVLTALMAQNDLQPLATIKITKSEPITVRQLKTRVEAVQKQNGLPTLTLDQKKEVLNGIIDERLLTQAAEKAKIMVTDVQVNQTYINFISNQIGKVVTELEFANLVREQRKISVDDFMREETGMNVSEFKAYIKTDLYTQQYVMSLKGNELNAAMPTDGEIRAQYEISKASLVQPEMMKVLAVSVPKGNDAGGARTKIQKLLSDVSGKKMSINELKAKSQNVEAGYLASEGMVNMSPMSAQQLGFTSEELLTFFSKNEGTFSEIKENPVALQFYVIMEKYPQKFLTLSDLVQPGTTVTVYEYIKNALAQAKQAQVFAELKQQLASTLRTSDNFKMEKSGDALDRLLNW